MTTRRAENLCRSALARQVSLGLSVIPVPYQDTPNEQHRTGSFGDEVLSHMNEQTGVLLTQSYLCAFVLQGTTFERRSGSVLSVTTCLIPIDRHGSMSMMLSLASVC